MNVDVQPILDTANAVWNQWEGFISLGFTARDLILMAASLVAILIVRRYFTTEPEKREAFWGYVPTLIVPVITKDRKVLLIKKVFTEPDGSLHEVYIFVQRVMKTAYEETEANAALEAELGLSPNGFQILSKEATLLGTRKISGLKKAVPSSLGFSLFRRSRGRTYRMLPVQAHVELRKMIVQKESFPWVTREQAFFVGQQRVESQRVDGYVLVDLARARELVIGSHTGPRREGKIPFLSRVFDELEAL